jgi:hypothetical protein
MTQGITGGIEIKIRMKDPTRGTLFLRWELLLCQCIHYHRPLNIGHTKRCKRRVPNEGLFVWEHSILWSLVSSVVMHRWWMLNSLFISRDKQHNVGLCSLQSIFFSSVAHVWVPGAKTTGPIAAICILRKIQIRCRNMYFAERNGTERNKSIDSLSNFLVKRSHCYANSSCTKRWPQTHSPGTPYTQHWR